MVHIEVDNKSNTFDKANLQKIKAIIGMITFNQPIQKIYEEIQKLSPKQYLWAITNKPAYFVQSQLQSSTILKVKDIIFIVWKPKYIQYPSMVVFPQFGDKKLKNLKLDIDPITTSTSSTNERLIQYLQKFYGTYFHSDQQFQTNLVTYAKHFISKVSSHSYWHVIYDDKDSLFVTQQKNMDNLIKIHVSGIKEGYNKTLLLFSYKGTRSNIFVTAKSKWMQVVSFLAMALIFYAVVACPSSTQNVQGICQYKSQITLFGAGMMLALIGMRYSSSKKDKKNKAKLLAEKQKNN